MNIFVSSTGRVLSLTKSSKKSVSCFGEKDHFMLVILELIKAHPEHTFYVDCRCEENTTAFSKPKYPSNMKCVRDALLNYRKEKNIKDIRTQDFYFHAVKYFKSKNIKLDKILVCKQHTKAVITPGGLIAKLYGGYCRGDFLTSSYSYVLGLVNSGIPYSLLMNDPREFVPMRDIMYKPEHIFTMTDIDIPFITIEGLFEKSLNSTESTVKAKYIDWVADKFGREVDYKKRSEKNPLSDGFVMFSNQATGRYKLIDEYVLKQFDCPVFGHFWERDFTEQTKDRFIDKSIREIEDFVYSKKYTLMLPVSNKSFDFCTSKFWESVYFGLIPFYNPDNYDTHNLLPHHPYTAVHSGGELKAKVTELNQNRELYDEVFDFYTNIIKERNIFEGKSIINSLELFFC